MDRTTLLTPAQKKAIDAYYHLLTTSGIQVDKVILFGSYAKGSAEKWSDLDLCIVSPQFGKDRFDEGVTLARLAYRIGDFFEPHPFHPKDLMDRYDPLAKEIRTHGIRII